MKKPCLYLLWALLLSAVSVSAQVKKGFQLLESKEYDKALACFNADLKIPDEATPATFGILKAAVGLSERQVWFNALNGYEKTLQTLQSTDKKVLEKWNSAYKLNQISFEQAYSSLFGKTIDFVEKQQDGKTLRDSFLNSVTVIPQSFKARFNKLMIDQQTNPVSTRAKIEANKLSARKPVYVDRKPPEGSKLVFEKGINTAGSEYVPILSSDGKLLYFVGSGRDDNYSKEDVYYAEKQEDGSWSEPKLETFFSGPGDEGVVSISADGNNLVLFMNQKPYLSTRTKTGWSEPRLIQLQVPFAWIGMASITRNGEALIFEARKFEFSDIDIYVAIQKKKGWEIPFSLGDVVNTDNQERTPFLHSDFKTLYFSSKGHGGEGGLDVFKTTRLDDTWKNWSKPENLGASVNTPKDEFGFCITPSGNMAYLATRISDFSDLDILRIPLDSAARPEAQVIVTGILLDGRGKAATGKITVEEAASQKILQTVTTQPNGKYAFSVPKTAKINYYASGDSLLTTKKTYLDASTYKGEVIVEKVEIVTVKEVTEGGKPIELKDLLFDFAKSDLRPEAAIELSRIYNAIKGFKWNIEIGGHTDNVGSEQSNLQLSTRRAKAVCDYLVAQGYPADKISYKGYGQSMPLEQGDTESARARNRRVEIKVKRD